MATYRQCFTLRITEELYDKIGRLATAKHRSMNNYIEYIILTYFDEHEEEDMDC